MIYLGDYIELLEQYPRDQKVDVGLLGMDSWRGQYQHLSISCEYDTTVGAMLDDALGAVGTTYTGYKGGEFTMGLDTEVHLDRSGSWSDGGYENELFEILGLLPITHRCDWKTKVLIQRMLGETVATINFKDLGN